LGDRIKEVAQSLDPAKGIFLLTPRHQLVGFPVDWSLFSNPAKGWRLSSSVETHRWCEPIQFGDAPVSRDCKATPPESIFHHRDIENTEKKWKSKKKKTASPSSL
jgi:hypothetical protein